MKTTTVILSTLLICSGISGAYSYKYGTDGSRASRAAVNPSNPIGTGDYIVLTENGQEELYKARHPSVSCIGGEFFYEGQRQSGTCQQYKDYRPYNMTESEFNALVKAGLKISQ